jgi:tetratricopeptide (TPR) repeat protein
MLRREHLGLWAGGALLSLAGGPTAFAQTPARGDMRAVPPTLRLVTPAGFQPVRLAWVDVQADIVGRAVCTRVELHLHNPNSRVLEAELQFPLLEGQSVTGFALDVGGELRAAVPVEKARGREVFEAIVRRGVDPALLEVTQGQQHRLRVYPIGPGANRRVVLHLGETLGVGAAGAALSPPPAPPWRLPLRLGSAVDQLDVSVRVTGVAAAAVVASVGSEALVLQDDGAGNAWLRWSQRKLAAEAGAGITPAAEQTELRLLLPAVRPGAVNAAQTGADVASAAASSSSLTTGAVVSSAVVNTGQGKGLHCFYAELPLPAAWLAEERRRPRPRQVTLWWDASGSGASRDHALELDWLGAWLEAVGDTQVQLVELRDVALPARRFEVRGGRWDTLRLALQAMAYDGASSLGELRAVPGSDLALLFSDGLGNYGPGAPLALAASRRGRPAGTVGGAADAGAANGAEPTATAGRQVPLLALAATPDADARALRRLAEASGGAYIDLLSIERAQALALAQQQRCRLLSLGGRGVSELEGAGQLADVGRFVVAGVLTAPSGAVELQVELPDGQRRSLTVAVQPRPAAEPPATALAQTGVAGVRWAQMRLARLQADPQRHRAAIRRLGQQFGLVTPETSLIVLETLADYVQHDIEPPPHWREQWLAQRRGIDAWRDARQPGGLPTGWAERQRWWATDFSRSAGLRQGDKAAPDVSGRAGVGPLEFAEQAAARESVRVDIDAAARQKQIDARLREQGFRTMDLAPAQQAVASVPIASPAMAMAAPPVVAAMPLAATDRLADATVARRNLLSLDRQASQGGAQNVIRLQAWQPDSRLMQRLRAAAPADRYALYLDERAGQARSSAFFIDMAELFLTAGQTELGLRVLSNLAELALENRQLLRILAFRLLAAGQWRTAVPVLERVLALAPDEPQSWRDLALALARAGQPQRAVELLWQVGTRAWPRQSPGLAELALAELGTIAARHAGLNLSGIDPACLQPMPLALRVLLSWDADNTDVDLMVTDPDGELCSYQRPLTRQGGRLTADNTQGYGPEEFVLRVARPGVYTVQANFFGHRQQVLVGATTVMVQLSTHWGTPDQRDQQRVLRLDSQSGSVVTLGQFNVTGLCAARCR